MAVAQDDVSEVVVTGSRVVRDGAAAPTPVTVVAAEDLKAVAPQTLAEGLNQLPAFRGSSQPQTSSVASTSGLNGGNYLNLRGLGLSRTLVLLDGRRVTASTTTGATNIDLLPQDLVQRVDVVTGGASAAYGSDAVAGVVNFVLDGRFKGTKLELQGGISDEGDGESTKFSLSHGRALLGGRGHLIASGEYYKSAGISDVNDRDWASRRPGLFGAGPTFELRTGVTSPTYTYGGLITAVQGLAAGAPIPTANGVPLICRSGTTFSPCLEFAPGGVPDPFVRGEYPGGSFAINGDGGTLPSSLKAGLRRESAFSRFTYELTDTMEVFVEGSIAESRTRYNQLWPFQTTNNQFTIFRENAFLPDSVRSAMTSGGVTSFSMARVSRDFGFGWSDNLTKTWRFATGVKGKIGERWSYDAHIGFGESKNFLSVQGNPIHRNLYQAADAVRAPNGQIVCRSTLTNPGDGCVPINVFGEGSVTPEALNYVTGTSWSDILLKQQVAGFDVRGDLLDLWAGPLSVAFGGEYREEFGRQHTDPISQTRVSAGTASGVAIRGIPATLTAGLGALGGFSFTNAQPVKGSYNVKEVFLEGALPLLKDQPLARQLELNGAVRYTDYSTSGTVTTWKVGVSYRPVEDLRLRGTLSRDIRAPNISDLFRGSIQSQGQIRDPFRNNATVGFRGSSVGNPALAPEKADTLTIGAVYQPAWAPGLMLSTDYYDIKIDNAIGTVGAQFVLDQCFQSQSLCEFITRLPNGDLSTITTTSVNLASSATRGVDFEASYRVSLDDVAPFIGGDLSVRLLTTYLDLVTETPPGGVVINRAGDLLSSNPKWLGTLSANWKRGSWRVGVQQRYVGGGDYDVTSGTANSINTYVPNHIGAQWYTDLSVRYAFTAGETANELYVTVNNLFDNGPPLMPSGQLTAPRYTNFSLYDTMGRYVSGGIRMKF